MKCSRNWTEREDETLRSLVTSQTAHTIDWHKVASELEGRTNKDCRKRWAYCLAPNLRKGSWDASEIELLHQGVNAYDTKWARVAQHVQTRQADQCARRWHEVEKPTISRARWSLYESSKDHMLRNAVRAHGRRWTEIVERYFADRTPIAAKNRYYQISKLDEANENRAVND